MRILAHVPNYVPHGFGGAEVSMKATVEFLRSHGHSVNVIIDEPERSTYEYQGVEVHARPPTPTLKRLYRTSDVILSQQSSSIRSMILAERFGKPFTFFVRDVGEWRRLPAQPDLIVFNARWQRDMFEYKGNSLVLHPPIDPDLYRTSPGSKVTLINLNERKGGQLFLELVASMPDTDFLAVTDVWGDSMHPSPCPRNLRLVGPTEDMRNIYSETRILLLPSRWESFGRVAVEAAISGIPVVASPNPGTFEALGPAAIYARPSEPDEWISAIRLLENPKTYDQASQAVLTAAVRLDSRRELSALEEALQDLAKQDAADERQSRP